MNACIIGTRDTHPGICWILFNDCIFQCCCEAKQTTKRIIGWSCASNLHGPSTINRAHCSMQTLRNNSIWFVKLKRPHTNDYTRKSLQLTTVPASFLRWSNINNSLSIEHLLPRDGSMYPVWYVFWCSHWVFSFKQERMTSSNVAYDRGHFSLQPQF